MSENSTANRRFAYNNNRLFIEELPDSPSQSVLGSNRQILPAIRDASSLSLNQNNNNLNNNNNNNLQLALRQSVDNLNLSQRNSSFLNASLDLSNTQQRVKQLENRIQVTEVNNRALLEEVIRLQNELALSLRRSFDSLQEERTARQILENNYKFQTETVLQLNGRLKRTEDSLIEDRTAMQSLIFYTRNLEQSSLNAQKDLTIRRDFQSQRLDELRMQIDELQRSKENLERNTYSLLDEIKNLKGKIEMESLNLNSVSGDLRNKTRRLEDENRQQIDVLRKQQDSMANTENNMLTIKLQLENKISEVRDTAIDLKNKLEHEKQEKRNLDQNLTIKFSEFNTLFNEEKLKINELQRSIEVTKRELNQNLETDRTRFNTLLADMKDYSLLITNDKIEKSKEDLINRIRDVERHLSDESDKRVKLQQNLKESTENRLENMKRILEDEIRNNRDETRESLSKQGESIKKLNEGLILIEKQSDERIRQLEKVISAEIKSRKINEKDLTEKLENQNEKFTYAMQSFQSTVGSLNNKMTEQTNSFVSKTDFELAEKKHERLQGDLSNTNLDVNSLKESFKYHQNSLDVQSNKLKDLSDTVFKLDSIQIPAVQTLLSQMSTKEELNNFKKENENRLKEESDKLHKKNEETIEKTNKDLTTRFENFKADIDLENNKSNNRHDALENTVNFKMADKLDEYDAWKKTVNDNIEKLKARQEKIPLELNHLEEQISSLKIEQNSKLKEEIRTRNTEIEKIKNELDKLERKLLVTSSLLEEKKKTSNEMGNN